MLRTLLVAQNIEDYSIEFANALAHRAQVTLVAPERIFKRFASFVDPAVDLRLMDWPRHRSLSNPRFVWRLIRMMDAVRPDVVHVLYEGVVWFVLAIPTAKKYGLVTTLHDVTYHAGDHVSRRVPRCFANRLVLSSHRVIVHGDGLRDRAERFFPAIKDRIEVLPHLQLERYCGIARSMGLQRRSDPTINVLFYGRIHAYKGLEYLLRSLPLVTPHVPDIRVIIAGQGDDIRLYEQWMGDRRSLEIRNRLVPDVETAQVFTDADIVVLPYVEASQSGVLAMAQAFAKPVIVTDVGELGRSVEHGVTGLVIPPRNETALADAIVQLASDENLRTQLGTAGRQAAQATASAARVAESALRIYDDLIRSRRAGMGRVLGVQSPLAG